MKHASLTALILFVSACAVTADDVHSWGYHGQYEKISRTVRGNPPEEVRVAAAIELGKGDFAWGIDDLVRLAADPSPRVRLAAVEALGHYAGARVYSALIQRTGDENAEVMRAAESVLRTWSEAEAIDFLLAALTDTNYRVRASALRVLGGLRDPRIPAALVERARRDDNPLVRRAAVQGLGALGYKPARLLLWEIKNTDTATEVALEAEGALGKIGGRVTDSSFAVLLPAAERDLRDSATLVRDAVVRELGAAHLGELAPGDDAPVAASGDLSALALERGRTHKVDQVIAGRVRRSGNTLTATLYRYDVASGRLAQQEEVTGYDDKRAALAEELAKLFVQRYR